MGAASLKAGRHLPHRRPSRAALRRVFCFLRCVPFENKKRRRRAGTGDPDPGRSRGNACAPKRGACWRERGESRTPIAGRTKRVRFGGAILSRAPRRNLFFNLPAEAGSTHAGGEDFGYFSPPAGNRLQSIVPWNPSGEMGASRVPGRPQGRTCVSIVERRYRPFPSVLFQTTGGEESCYFAQVKVDGSNPSGDIAVAQRQSVIASQEAVRDSPVPRYLILSPARAKAVVKMSVTSVRAPCLHGEAGFNSRRTAARRSVAHFAFGQFSIDRSPPILCRW